MFCSCSDCKIWRRASRKPLCSSACKTHTRGGVSDLRVQQGTRDGGIDGQRAPGWMDVLERGRRGGVGRPCRAVAYLFELQLGPLASIGVGVEGRDDATSNCNGIHLEDRTRAQSCRCS